ncbi:hypothetical protein NM688_g8745 [Phlebia brevispora]|uniref:Uncharacterized protein n=1 Tax=Phlebia brevispora TaxID=194682 RepID=A0ACC1RP21_9APHY|nr:hypothetical protein NM688_g8745 [Phlebia brevispora]
MQYSDHRCPQLVFVPTPANQQHKVSIEDRYSITEQIAETNCVLAPFSRLTLSMPFEEVELNDGTTMPSIAFGTGSKWKGHDVTSYVEQAIELGFSHIDTAQFYGTEQYVGTAIRESGLARADIYVTTKYSGLGTPSYAINNSLQKLGLKSVDLYLIHNPASLTIYPGLWSQFEKFQELGLTKSIGVSNFNLEQLQSLVSRAKVVPAVNQINFSPYNYAQNKELLEYSKKHGIVTEAYSSLSPITRYPGGPVDKPVNAAAKRLEITPTQVILSWVRSKGVVIVTTSSTKEHMQEYLEVADLPPLTDEEIAAIDEAGAKGPPTLSLIWADSRPTAMLALVFMKALQTSITEIVPLVYFPRRAYGIVFCCTLPTVILTAETVEDEDEWNAVYCLSQSAQPRRKYLRACKPDTASIAQPKLPPPKALNRPWTTTTSIRTAH